MKKYILAFASICMATAAATGLGACDLTPPETAADEYGPLNEMLGYNYSKITLTVTDNFSGGLSLTDEYVINYSDSGVTVNYSVERFASISLDAPAAELTTTYEGKAVIKNGKVENTEGSEVNFSADIADRAMCFDGKYFENAELTSMYFKADVKDASGFMGTKITCTDMKVEATFLEIFYDLKITYKSESGNTVQLSYVFTL